MVLKLTSFPNIEILKQQSHCITIMNEYIQKYGSKALEIYKKTLNQNQQHDNSKTPRDNHVKSKGKEKNNSNQKFNKKSTSRKRSSHNSKSCKNLKNQKQDKHALNKTNKNKNSRSLLEPNEKRKSNCSIKQGAFKPGFSNLNLNLNNIINPKKKKLIISDISTPRQTPCKSFRPNSNKLNANGINTNVNVFVNAYNNSKEKSRQNSSNKRYYLSKSKSQSKRSISKHKQNQGQLINTLIHLIDDERSNKQKKFLKNLKGKLIKLKLRIDSKDRKYHNIERKYKILSDYMRKQSITSTKNNTKSISLEESRDKREEQMGQRIFDLENQLKKYVEKEKSLIRIIETMEKKENLKELQCLNKYSDEQEEEEESY